ncbi:dihydrolipoamide acetyltransferase family protein [Cryptosporangium phraense]|uniref:Dihydrolipoamide acetyltransferase component of pyruvate dehydrogenase complex n=1 Tax=Cryptosporangium phraense TaxID=2593070 RepID=A0A545APY4_9ACTN|nr:dihydrolipoamide acetyltransferase family protein [Cryptosporangium phraense]TQS43397.1 2-oxo acid dehydrogenase subunit E2 [Cryptosporangium phraense]
MAKLLRVPEVAAGATEVIVADWLVAEQASVSAGQPLVTIETEKAVVDVPADADAVLLKTLVASGASVEVGAPMALIGDDAEKDADVADLLAGLGVGAPAPTSRPAAPEPETAPEPAPEAVTADAGGRGRIFITPLARRMLADAGHGPEAVSGTGPNGRILRRDVAEFLDRERSAPDPAPPAETTAGPAATNGGYEEIPHTRLRRAVASRLTASKQTIPHFYVKRTARLDSLLALRAQLNAVSSQRISVNDLLILAVGRAYRHVPDANVVYTEDSLHRYATVDVSVAIASERGLVTPVVRGVEALAPSAVAGQVKQYAADADAGRLRQHDLDGGVISISNLGMYGVEEFSAIINPPQSAILAVGAGAPGPAVVDGELAVATLLPLVLSVDHRAIDGALAAQWMAALVEAIEEPLRLLT